MPLISLNISFCTLAIAEMFNFIEVDDYVTVQDGVVPGSGLPSSDVTVT